MAIAFARARYISRSSGGSAVRSAAYNAREAIQAERTGQLYYFKHRDAPEHHEVLLPEGASATLTDAAVLWNAAEAAERRKDAQVAREIVLALPANAELTLDDRIELARRFAIENFVSKGLAVQLNVHVPHAGDSDSERANWHAHLLITTRRVEAEGFSAKKARDLEPEVKRVGGRAVVSEGEAWGEVWRDLQNRYFAELGLDIRVDVTSAVAQQHIGPIRMRAPEAEANARADETARANAKAARDPDQVLTTLTRNNATFSERDLERHLARHIGDAVEREAVKGRVLGHREVLALHDRETGELLGRFTTKTVRDQEQQALADAAEVAAARTARVTKRAKTGYLEGRTLRPDQLAAFEHAVKEGGLKIVEGRAGTGKSFTLTAIRDAHERAGAEVIGLAPTNAVAQDLRTEGGFNRAATVHSELFRIKNGLTSWGRGAVVIVDEAAMLDSRVTGELMAEAKRAGAKLILAGDDRQLASIERGGLFAELKTRHGSVAITEVTRQKVDWQRQAARDLAEGRFEEALRAFAREKAITWTAKQDEARAVLVEHWKLDTAAAPERSRFVFAYTNKDVDQLNAALRQVRVERGELGADHRFETKHGIAAFAVGDRVQFTDTLKGARIYNGNAGTITSIDGATGVIRAKLDGPAAGEGREVVWSVSEFQGFRHGYAGTIYKGQGKTLDQTYLLHTHHWRQASSYVALTRQRESAQVFVATETARDVRELARQMSRNEVKSASIAYATFDELSPAQRARFELEPKRAEVQISAAENESRAVKPEEGRAVLIPPFVDPSGRDSFGRGLDAESVLAAVQSDRRVAQERKDQLTYLEAAYRNPNAARERLNELVSSDGILSAARRIETEPSILGELQGKTGFFAGAAAKAKRAHAEALVSAIADNVRRGGEAQASAERAYRTSVEAQRAADAVPIPRLSERAQEALQAIATAKSGAEQLPMMNVVNEVRPELQAFAAAMTRRFGEDGVRAMVRSGTGEFKPPSVVSRQQRALDEAAKALRTIKTTERAVDAAQSERINASHSVGRTRGLKP